jgi:hypothetical protein
MPEELQWKYGYLPLSDEDKRKIFGGNLGKLLNIDTTKRRGGQKAIHDLLNDNTQRIVLTTPQEAKEEDADVQKNDYEVLISTPMGDMPGKVVLNIDGTSVYGTIAFMKNDNTFTGGTIDADGNVSFKGDLKTSMGKMPYIITGSLKNGIINAIAKTKMGDLSINSK